MSDRDLAQLIADERERFFGANDPALDVRITRWPNALPHYSIELERILTTLPPPPPNIVLAGNFLGCIGLAKILERAAWVAEEFRSRSICPTPGSPAGQPGWGGAAREASV